MLSGMCVTPSAMSRCVISFGTPPFPVNVNVGIAIGWVCCCRGSGVLTCCLTCEVTVHPTRVGKGGGRGGGRIWQVLVSTLNKSNIYKTVYINLAFDPSYKDVDFQNLLVQKTVINSP